MKTVLPLLILFFLVNSSCCQEDIPLSEPEAEDAPENSPTLPKPGAGEFTLDTAYWNTFGKDDSIRLVEPPSPYGALEVNTNFQTYGKTLVRGEGRIFGLTLHNFSGQLFDGQIRFALFLEDRLVERYPVYNIRRIGGEGEWDGIQIPCFVNAPPGNCRLQALLRSKGDTAWFIPNYAPRVAESDWAYALRETTDIPALTSVCLEGEGTRDGAISFVNLDACFNISYYLSNRDRRPLHGEIKAVWERTFGDFYNKAEDDGYSWSDEIGRTRLDLEEGVAAYRGLIPCKISLPRPPVSRWAPAVRLYYRPEGSPHWELMRNDCDYLFTLLQGIEDFYAEDNEGNIIRTPSVGFTVAENQTTNYVYLLLKKPI
jgi:hypothetical protein